MFTRNNPIKSVTCLLGWFRDELSHVVIGERATDMFGVIRERIIIVDVDVTKDEKISWGEAVVIK